MEMTNNPADGTDNNPANPPMPVGSYNLPEIQPVPATAAQADSEQLAEQPEIFAEQDAPNSLVSDLPPIPPQIAEHNDNTDIAFVPEAFPDSLEPAQPAEATDDMPDVSQMNLDDIDDEVATTEPVKATHSARTVAIVSVLLVVGLLYKANSGVLGSQRTKAQGYSYSFRFYRHSKLFAYGTKATALKHEIDSTIGSVRPTQTAGLTDCSKVGNGWKPVLHATINKADVPVCTPDNKSYIAIFPGAGHEQIFTVIYSSVQKPDIYPELKNILESVSVKSVSKT